MCGAGDGGGCAGLRICLFWSFFFFFLGQEQKVFHTICNSKKSHYLDKTSSEQPDSRSSIQGPLHQAVGEKGVCAFSKSNAKIRQIAPRRPLLPALFTQGSLLSSLLQGRRAGWPFLCLDHWSGACSLSLLKGHQPTKLLQN